MSKRIDYDSIEPDWRAGIKSPEQLAKDYHERTRQKISRPAILKHFKIAGIPRDLTKKIQESADRKVQLAQAKVSDLELKLQRKLTEQEIVEENAKTQADVRNEHSYRSTDNRHLLESMIDELKLQNIYQEDLSKLGELMLNSDVSFDKLNEVYHKIISFPGRVDSVKKLMESWAKIVDTERKVYAIDTMPSDPGDRIGKIIHEIVDAKCGI